MTSTTRTKLSKHDYSTTTIGSSRRSSSISSSSRMLTEARSNRLTTGSRQVPFVMHASTRHVYDGCQLEWRNEEHVELQLQNETTI